MVRARFVLLRHDLDGIHYDLMLEVGSVLRTWRLAQPPTPDEPQPAEASFDHRIMYLDYEGPVGGNRGDVTRCDAGTFIGEATGETEVRVILAGNWLRGAVELRRIAGSGWELRYRPD